MNPRETYWVLGWGPSWLWKRVETFDDFHLTTYALPSGHQARAITARRPPKWAPQVLPEGGCLGAWLGDESPKLR